MSRPIVLHRLALGIVLPLGLGIAVVAGAGVPARADQPAVASPSPAAASPAPDAAVATPGMPTPTPSPTATATAAPSSPIGANTFVDVDAGTLGFGGGIGETFPGGLFDVRVLTGFFDTSFNGSEDSVNYTGNVRLSNVLLMADVHPGGGGFHVGAGLSVGSTAATANAVAAPGGGFIINNTPYTAAQLSGLNAGVRLGTAPVALLGFGGGSSHHGLSLNFDLGAIFENPTSYVNPVYGPAPGGIDDPSTPQGQQFQQNLAVFQNDLKSAASYLHTYPVLNLGLAYHF